MQSEAVSLKEDESNKQLNKKNYKFYFTEFIQQILGSKFRN